MNMTLAFDPGYGNIKLYGSHGGLVLPSTVATCAGASARRMEGLRWTRPPLRIRTAAGPFYVGEGAHDWGRPVENLDLDRLSGAPELLALFQTALTRYGATDVAIDLIVGLPIAALLGQESEAIKQGVRRFLLGSHRWQANEVELAVEVERVRITSQPVGAMFDYLLDEQGEMPADRQSKFQGEIAILGIGMNTVELLVVRDRVPVQRFTAGDTLGVRRLLALVAQGGTYSLAELDAQLRAGSLDVRQALPVWQSEVMGFIERAWGDSHRRFAQVVVVGGGAQLLREALLRRFQGRAFIADDPIIATARGLYKYLLSLGRRREQDDQGR